MKICETCHKEKDLVEFNVHHNSADGRFSWCKDCHDKKMMARHVIDLNNPKKKICYHCNEEKSIDEFGKHSAMPDGKNVYCRKCHSLKNKESRLANRKSHSPYKKPIAERTREEQVSTVVCYLSLSLLEQLDMAVSQLNEGTGGGPSWSRSDLIRFAIQKHLKEMY